MQKYILPILVLLLITSYSCSKEDVDDVKPLIDMNIEGVFPINCSQVQRGSNISFKVKFTDNVALGSYSIDIHHNFDHHSHATAVEVCNLDAIKSPVLPWTFIQNYSIPEGQDTYIATGSIAVPNDIDLGDYHFMYKVTDNSGWQTLNGFTIKIVE